MIKRIESIENSITRLHGARMLQAEISQKLKTNQSTISRIIKIGSYKHLCKNRRHVPFDSDSEKKLRGKFKLSPKNFIEKNNESAQKINGKNCKLYDYKT